MNLQPAWFPSHLHELSRDECLELLDAHRVGRVAYCDADGPVVLPVNYRLNGDRVLIRVASYSALAQHLRSGPASFQVDDYDEYTQSGWSVLVRGLATFVPTEELPEDERRPTPWAEGQRTFHVHVTPTDITGRRLLAA